MKPKQITEKLFQLQDKAYANLQSKILPTLSSDTIIGVRTPHLRSLAKELVKDKDVDLFLSSLPHRYFDENQLHAFVISEQKDFARCIDLLQTFLPFIDNWATCDQLSPKLFKKESPKLLSYIKKWIKSKHTYTVRFAIGTLMQYFLDEKFDCKYHDMVTRIKSNEYYINMMRAWYFATALAKQYDSTIVYLKEKKLDPWTHNKTIQKGVESFRLTDKQKKFLKTLKI